MQKELTGEETCTTAIDDSSLLISMLVTQVLLQDRQPFDARGKLRFAGEMD